MRRKGAMKKDKGFTLGELVIVLAVIALSVAALRPLIRGVQEKAVRAVCRNNLRELSKAAYVYAKENHGKFPDGIKALYDERYLGDEGLIDCPGNTEKGTPANPDYDYTAGLSILSPSGDILMGDKPQNHASGQNHALLVNGEISEKKRIGL